MGTNSTGSAQALALIGELRAIVGVERVLTERSDLEHYGVDHTTVWQPAPTCVVLPASIDEVQAIVRLANRDAFALVPSGGRTGLSGGAVACRGEIVVAMERMNRLVDFDPLDRSVTVQAGMLTAQLQQFAQQQGLFYPVDFAAAGSSQIGGNIATNAGGIKVIRYGMTRDWIRGLKIVDGNGTIMDLNRGLVKNNTGFDFRHLFIGSEGTLGIICEATLGLIRPPGELTVLVLGVRDFPVIMDVLASFREAIDLCAFEFFSDQGLQKVLAHNDVPAPFARPAPFYVLLEFEQDGNRELELAMSRFEQCVDKGWVLDGVVSQSLQQAENLWKLRENLSETLAQWHPYKSDISVSISKMPAFIEQVDTLVGEQYAGFEVVWYGHIGDGNLHLNILKPDELVEADFVARCASVSKQVAALVHDYSGSISAEHGIGLLKKDYLGYTRSESELAAMRQIKRIFDPNGIMNPGKIFDPV